jgi:hypothetical protein
VKHLCRGCGAEIVWATGRDSRKRVPFDPEPTPNGSFALQHGVAIYVPPKDRGTGSGLYRPHWATCPNAAEFRRPKEVAAT